MSLTDLADELMEIRRYVRSDPEHVKERLKDLHRWIIASKGMYSMGTRLSDNIFVGESYIHADPEILEGCLYAAAREIQAEARRREREG